MDYNGIYELTGLKPRIIRFLEREGTINGEPSFDDLQFMQTLGTICEKMGFIKTLCTDFNPTKRARIVFSSGLNSIDSYIINRWIAHYAERADENLGNTTYLHASQVVDETMNYLGLPAEMKKTVTASVYKLRKRARNLVYRNEDIAGATAALVQGKRYRTERKKVTLKNMSTTTKYKPNDIFGY